MLKPPPKGYDNPVSDMDLKPPTKPNSSIRIPKTPTLLYQKSPAQKSPPPPQFNTTPQANMDRKLPAEPSSSVRIQKNPTSLDQKPVAQKDKKDKKSANSHTTP